MRVRIGRKPRPDTAEPDVTRQEAAGAGHADASIGRYSAVDHAIAVAGVASERELYLLVADHAMSLEADMAYVFRNDPSPAVVAVSGMPEVNRRSPFILDLERFVAGLLDSGVLGATGSIDLAGSGQTSLLTADHGFRFLAWAPLGRGQPRPHGGVLYSRRRPWEPAELTRLAERSALYSLRLIDLMRDAPPATRARSLLMRAATRRTAIAMACVAAALLVIPTSMTVRAPFQVTSRNHVIVSAPIAGIVEAIEVEPGSPVKAGEPLLRFVGTELANAVTVARSRAELAETAVRRASQLSFDSDEGSRELGLAMADLQVKRAELQLALDQFERASIVAAADGIVLYSDPQSLLGKPLGIGERILEIADPSAVEYEISLDVSDAIALETGARVTLYPDNSPLSTERAVLSRIGYLPEPDAQGRLSYKLIAEPAAGGDLLRLGTTGTARIEGGDVPLAFYLFRRPVAALRQWLAW